MTTFTTQDRQDAQRPATGDLRINKDKDGRLECFNGKDWLHVVDKNIPMAQEAILDIWYAMENSSNDWTRYVEFARAIERAHGIGE